jgi:hypothetical protein
MYSPKISDKYIPVLYKRARALQVPMTRLVNQIIADALKEVIDEQNGTLAVGEETSLPAKVDRRSRRNGNPPCGVPYQP